MTGRPSDPAPESRSDEPEARHSPEPEAEQLALRLRHAFAPREIAGHRHEQLLASVLEQPFAEASAVERLAGERLGRALEGSGEHPDVALLHAVAAAHLPKWIADERLAQLSARLVSPGRARVRHLPVAGLATALAIAAGISFWFAPANPHAHTPLLPRLVLVQERSAAELVEATQATDTSARVDRIASARARDLRENRWLLWGVK